MPKEIERKFLVDRSAWQPPGSGEDVRQGYISTEHGRIVRVRLTEYPDGTEKAYLTVKGERVGISTDEWEVAVRPDEAREMLAGVCRKPLIEKTRYRITHTGRCWEVDEFRGENTGLILAEIELDRPDEEIDPPPFVGEEVTADRRYTNAYLVTHPYSTWGKPARLGPRFEDALLFAARLHAEQKRKGSSVPYVSHLLAVCGVVLEWGADEDTAIAALLHDAVEDQGGMVTLERIRERFGEQVAVIVDQCTDARESPKPPWHERKQAFLDRTHAMSAEARLVCCADKLHNVRTMIADHRHAGEELWKRFNATADEILWYHREVAERLSATGLSQARELGEAVEELERMQRAACGGRNRT